jgi:ribA/ribD-fused uncharacterized protein
MAITWFRGQYDFLSNFYENPVTVNGITYRNSEAAFQAQKCPERANEFSDLTGKEAKKLGRKVNLREDWNEARISVMEEVLKAKFKDETLKQKLIATGDSMLVEGNNWGDRYWGVVNGNGKNNLGLLLMKVREDIK